MREIRVRVVATFGIVRANEIAQRVSGADPDTTSGTALVMGATSDIGRAIAVRLGRDGWKLQLAARNPEQLKLESRDLQLRGVSVSTHECDLLDCEARTSLMRTLPTTPDIVVCAVGLLGDQTEAESDAAVSERIMLTNYVAPALFMNGLAQRFEQRGSGVLIGISSVAGERGRRSNHMYGSAKSGFTAFLSGLRSRLFESGIRVITVKPGFVRTRMTDHLDLPALLTVDPEDVAEAIVTAIRKHRDTIYVGSVWRLVSCVIRAIPEAIFKRLSL